MKLYVINRDNERIYLNSYFGDTTIITRKDIPYLFCVNCQTFNRDKVHIEEDQYVWEFFIIIFGLFGFMVFFLLYSLYLYGSIGATIGAIIGAYLGLKKKKEDREIVKNFDS